MATGKCEAGSGWVFTCEYQQAPLGVDNPAPRFGWRWQGDGAPPAPQAGCHVEVRDDTDAPVWDSGPMDSQISWAVPYAGPPLASAHRYSWSATVRLTDGAVAESGEQHFETGLLRPEDWGGAVWIGAPAPRRGAAPLLRRSFVLEAPPERGRLYLSGLGYAEVWLNGRRVDDSRLDPAWTDYGKTVLYRTWDVGSLLQKGENVLAVELGEGWQGLVSPIFTELLQRLPSWLAPPRLLCLLRADGFSLCSAADGSWLAGEGPVLQNSIYDGEMYDARLEKPGWQAPGYEPSPAEWLPAPGAKAPGGVLRSQQLPPIRETRRIAPACVTYPNADSGTVVVDMGVNIAGWAEITLKGPPGGQVRLRYAEVLHPDGSVNQDNLRSAKATDTYILGGTGQVTWHSRFTYHGFRYVQIEMEPGVVVYSVCGVCVNTDVRQLGAFTCGNEVLNKTYQAVLRTEQNNLHGVPTDCPQRDERLAWLNDAAVRCEEAIINFDMALFYDKWLQDIADAQDAETGALPDTAPYFFGSRPGEHVTSTFVLIPWFLYLYYGDRQPMARHFGTMSRYVRHKLSRLTGQGLLPEEHNYGDWAAPMTVSQLGWGQNAVPANIEHSFLTTGYLYYDCLLMARMAALLGESESAFFEGAAQKLRAALNATYRREDGGYAKNSQGENAFAHFLGVEEEGWRGGALKHLLADLRDNRGWHVTTGNQMTKYLFEVLGEAGLVEDAFKVAAREDYPSFGYMLVRGATTIWERWEYLVAGQMNSHDHPMLGAFSVWFQKYLAGIRPCYTNDRTVSWRIAPGLPGALSHASAAVPVPGGVIRCGWERLPDGWDVEVCLPWNTEGSFEIPPAAPPVGRVELNGRPAHLRAGDTVNLPAGRHHVRFIDESGSSRAYAATVRQEGTVTI